MLSSRWSCWNRTYSGIAIAIGGRIRCEISQKATSLLPKARLKRRPIDWARIRKMATAEAIAMSGGAPKMMATKANTMEPMNRPTIPTLG